MSHQLKTAPEQYKTNIEVERVDRKEVEDPVKKERIDKTKYSGKVTSTSVRRDEKRKGLKGVEWKLSEKNEQGIETGTFYGSQVEGADRSKHALLFVRPSTTHALQFTAVPVTGWMQFHKDIENMRNVNDPLLRMTKEQQREKVLKRASNLHTLTDVLESEGENPERVAKLEKGLQPIKLFKPRKLRTEEEQVDPVVMTVTPEEIEAVKNKLGT